MTVYQTECLPIDKCKCFICENFTEDKLHVLFDFNCYCNLKEYKDIDILFSIS